MSENPTAIQIAELRHSIRPALHRAEPVHASSDVPRKSESGPRALAKHFEFFARLAIDAWSASGFQSRATSSQRRNKFVEAVNGACGASPQWFADFNDSTARSTSSSARSGMRTSINSANHQVRIGV